MVAETPAAVNVLHSFRAVLLAMQHVSAQYGMLFQPLDLFKKETKTVRISGS